jgi:hypothetical protein
MQPTANLSVQTRKEFSEHEAGVAIEFSRQPQELTCSWMSLFLLPAPANYSHNCGI